MVFKEHIFKISLALILLLTGLLCIYAIYNYHGDVAPTRIRSGPVNFLPDERNRLPVTQNQIPGGQLSIPNSRQHMAPPPNGRMGGRITMAGANYASWLAIYSITFLALFIAAYYLYIYKKIKIHPGNESILILTLLCTGLLLRISVSTLIEGHPFDINTFKSWATAAANNLLEVYSNRSIDYPPLYIYILFLIGKTAGFAAMSPYFTLLLKLPSIITDIATSYLIYKLARKYLTPEISILISAFYIFNPAVFINSTFWGQVDSFFTFIVISAVILLAEKRIAFAAALFTAAVMMKPQGIIFLPVLFFELVREKSPGSFLKAAVFALGTAAIIILPFSLNHGVLWIEKLFSNTIAEYPYASVNAFNFFCLIGKNYTRDTATLFIFSYHTWGMIFIVVVTALSWFIYIKGNNRIFASAAALLLIAGVFTFSTRMHERYLFPAAALSILTFIYLRDKRLLLLSAGFSTTIYINTHFILFEAGNGINSVFFKPALIITSLLNVLLFVYLVKVLFDIAIKKRGASLHQVFKPKSRSPAIR
ncbi:glycosyltransferase family 39 protein [Neomoorella thermoacetica]|uniref:glycosyltransferase family 39 protein n=1 Tax=Neomoorella thermoacetica TaxID=1525 RepID=UPI000908428A|nr:glycosyltransferase family 39 protein [Moorella thermoacetica]APC09554.1 hypothetical protein MTJW_24090 [Moorella thermoacetica]